MSGAGDIQQSADAMSALREAVERAGSAQAWARGVGLSPSYVHDVRLGRRPPGPRLLAALGLQRVVSYAPAIEGVRS